MNEREQREVINALKIAFMKINPADGFARPTPWRVELAREVLNSFSCSLWRSLRRWALVENLNDRSYMRVSCPLKLKGSGRWRARDKGGRYVILKQVVLDAISYAWIDQSCTHPLIELEGILKAVGVDISVSGFNDIKKFFEEFLQYAEEVGEKEEERKTKGGGEDGKV